MIESKSAKFLFIHIQRTGGTSLTQLLRSHFRDTHAPKSQHDNFKTKSPDELQAYSDYFKFTFVRNPWERISSWYSLLMEINRQSHKVSARHYLDFLKSLDKDCQTNSINYFEFNQLDYLTPFSNQNIPLDFVGRFEHYEQDVCKLFKHFEIENLAIPKINITLFNHRELYNEQSIEFIYNKCRKDIEYFGYTYN